MGDLPPEGGHGRLVIEGAGGLSRELRWAPLPDVPSPPVTGGWFQQGGGPHRRGARKKGPRPPLHVLWSQAAGGSVIPVDSEHSAIFQVLQPACVERVSRLILTRAHHPRAADPEALARIAHSHGLAVQIVEPMDAALLHAIRRARPGEVILAAGSLFVAGEARTVWEAIRDKAMLSVGETI